MEFGWKHLINGKYASMVQVKKRKGGGNRTVGMPRHAKYKECLLKAQNFFPNLNSQYGNIQTLTPIIWATTMLKKWKRKVSVWTNTRRRVE